MIRKYLYLYKVLFTISLVRMMENRFDFIFRFIPTTLTLILNVLTVNFIYSRVNEISGWQKSELFLLMGTYYIVWGIFFGLFIQNLGKINKYVRRGDLDLFLTKPIDSQFYISTRVSIDFGEAATLVTGVYLVFLSLSQLNIHPSLMDGVIYIFLILNAVILAYSLWFITMTFSIWLGKLPELHEAFLSLYEINKYPIDIYQGILKTFFIFFLPLAVMVTFPTRFLLGSLSLSFIFWSFASGLLTLYVSHVFWNFALKRYTSASS